jgi:hypothetical protein
MDPGICQTSSASPAEPGGLPRKLETAYKIVCVLAAMQISSNERRTVALEEVH